MAQCPRCKEDMPLLSKICPVCGHVEEGGDDENSMSVSDFMKVLEARLNEIKFIPEPSFMKGMGHFTFIIYPILAITFFLIYQISNAGLFLMIFGLFLILSIIALVRKSKGTLGYTPFNRWFKVVQNDFDYHKRVAQHSFGKSSEVSKLINEISQEIDTVGKKRTSALRRNTIIWSVIVILLLGFAGFGVMAASSAVDEIETTEQSWTYMVEEYQAGNAPNAEQARVNIINAMLEAGADAEAEEFFVTNCMGQLQDMECATAIVKHYNDLSDAEGAKLFVESCTGMRYSSDRNKLLNLIK